MIIHYLKIALRKLGKNYIFSSINIGGLVIALASAFLIFHFVLSELTTDHFHKNKNDIYRNILWLEDGEDKIPLCSSSYILAENIAGKFPEIENIARLHSHDHNYGGQYIIKDDTKIKASNFYVTETSFFDIFTFKIIQGNKNNLLPNSNALLISESMSEKYFPDQDPIGKTLEVENTKETRHYMITAVFEDLPANSTFKFNFIGHIEMMDEYYRSRGWWLSGTDTYYKLKKGSDPKILENKVNEFVYPQLKTKRKYTHELQALTDIYFGSEYIAYYRDPQGNYKLILTYTIIGIIILVIASINYIIISTASSAERMTEIGMRKVMGAKRLTIINQMITESILVTSIALPLAIIVSEFALPTFNQLIGKQLEINYFSNWFYLFGIFVITLFISLISGSYISVFVSRFSPEQIFKKRFSSKSVKFNFRKVLIIIQIASFMVLFCFSTIIIKQIDYLMNKKIGYEAKNLINVIPPHDHYLYSCKAFKDELLKHPSIEIASEVNVGVFSGVIHSAEMSSIDDPENKLDFRLLQADHDFIETMKFDLVEGRFFDRSMSSDTSCIIINKTAVKKLKLKNPIDEVIVDLQGERFRIIGIVDDFHYKSMHNIIPPMGILLTRHEIMVDRVIARVNEKANLKQTLEFIEKSWYDYGPKGQFKYEFFEESVKKQYADDKNFSDTIKLLTILTVLIAAFGIFGFTFYSAKQRVKEIGIRKTYGASVSNIVQMIFRELGLLIGISGLLSAPIAYIVAENWLSNYAYRINFPYWIFVIVLIISAAIVLITTGITAYNAANRNPVDALRYE